MHLKYSLYWERLDNIFAFGEGSLPSYLYFFPDQLARVWILISIVATPYILWLLFKLKKYGWLVTFFIFVGLPFMVTARINYPNLQLLTGAFAIAMLIIFHYLLRISYKNWREPVFLSKKNTRD